MIQRHLMFFLIFTCFATSFFRSSYHIRNLKTWLVSRGSRKCKKKKKKGRGKKNQKEWTETGNVKKYKGITMKSEDTCLLG